ncbi:MAG: hypothetical protein R3D62_07490 [Xanthobacteraceae bacterium]
MIGTAREGRQAEQRDRAAHDLDRRQLRDALAAVTKVNGGFAHDKPGAHEPPYANQEKRVAVMIDGFHQPERDTIEARCPQRGRMFAQAQSKQPARQPVGRPAEEQAPAAIIQGRAGQESRSRRDIGPGIEQGEQSRYFGGVVREIGVHGDDPRVAPLARMHPAEPMRRADPEPAGSSNDADPIGSRLTGLNLLSRAVRGVIVDDHDVGFDRKREDGVDQITDRVAFVEGGDANEVVASAQCSPAKFFCHIPTAEDGVLR